MSTTERKKKHTKEKRWYHKALRIQATIALEHLESLAS